MRERVVKQYDHIDWTGLRQLRSVSKLPRTGRPYTQTEMAAQIGIKQQAYSKIEKGQVRSPSEQVVNEIAAALGTTASDLLDALPKKIAEKAATASKGEAQQVIPKYHQPYQPKGFPYYDSILLENADSTDVLPSLRHVIGAYALVMPSDTMEPRYRAGDVLFVNPELQPYYGDDVVLRVRYKNRTVGVVREVLNQEPVYSDKGGSDPMQSVGLMSLKHKQKLSLKTANPGVDYHDDYLHLSEKADWFTLDEDESKLKETEDEDEILAITAHVIIGSENRRWMEQRRPLSNPDENERPFRDPQDIHEYFAVRELEIMQED
jgi:transcriptional regulator with XRE-family HTH domain